MQIARLCGEGGWESGLLLDNRETAPCVLDTECGTVYVIENEVVKEGFLLKTERFYRTKRSTVAHYSFCPYLGGHPDKAESMELEPAMLYSGQYRFCQFCSPVSVQYRTARKDIERLAAEYGQNLTLSRGILSVTNGYSAWLLVPGGRSSLNLYHKNTLNKLEDNTSPIEGYHLQREGVVSIPWVLTYISQHDAFRKSANAQIRAEKKHIQELTAEACDTHLKNERKKKPNRRHHVHKKSKAIQADTSDWEAFRALFKSNVSE